MERAMPTDTTDTTETSGGATAWPKLQAAYGAAAKALDRALVPVGTTLPQLQALQVIAAGPPPVTPSRLAEALALETQSVTGLVDRLAGRGWVERCRDLPDRRELRLQLTDPGQSLLLEAAGAMDAALGQVLAGLTPAELGFFARLQTQLE
jgi:DNA-binding MarR family transcriptional regulator